MSGHSKWSTIKRQKESNDKARGNLFSKLARAISIAAKQGGTNQETNYKLRIAVDTAKRANMPKSNIDRLLARAGEKNDIQEIVYEGFGPEGVQLVVEVATDNKNRSVQEIKMLIERSGGSLGGPGSVLFNFDHLVCISIETTDPSSKESMMLQLIDFGVEDVVDTRPGIDVYVRPEKLSSTKEFLETINLQTENIEFIRKPKALHKFKEVKNKDRTIRLLEELYDLEDTQNVFSNME